MSRLDSITEAFARKVQRDQGLESGSLRFVFSDLNGSVFIDGSSQPNTVSNEDGEADCTVFTSCEVIERLIKGDIDGLTAVQTNLITIVGDLKQVIAFGPAEGDLPGGTIPLVKSNLRFPFDSKITSDGRSDRDENR